MISISDDGSVHGITSNGNSLFLNNKENQISVTQKDGSLVALSKDGVTISDSSGKQIVNVGKDTVQLTSGNTLVEQSSSHTIDSGGVSIKGGGGAKIKDSVGGEVNIQNGMVAMGNSAAELLDLISQAFTALSTTTAPGFGAPISSVATFAQLSAKIALIKGSL
jgi:hypothetical protein